MVWIYYLLLLITDIAGLVLASFTLPGLWLMLAAAAFYAYLTRAHYLGLKSLVILLILCAVSEIGEIFLGGAGAKKAGASRWGILGGLIGAILGGIFLTGVIPITAPISTIIGICLGSFVGAFGIEMILGQSISQSMKIGWGAAKGRMFGIAGKITIGILMFLITLIAAIPIGGSHPAVAAPTVAIPATSVAPTTAP
jgi:uncharacterized protein